MLSLPPRRKEWRQKRRVLTLIERCHVIEWAGPWHNDRKHPIVQSVFESTHRHGARSDQWDSPSEDRSIEAWHPGTCRVQS